MKVFGEHPFFEHELMSFRKIVIGDIFGLGGRFVTSNIEKN